MNEIIGSDLNDALVGTLDADIILGLDGDDTLEGFSASDTLNGGNGNDSISGNSFPLPAPIPIDPPIILGDAPTFEDLTLLPFDLGDLILGKKGDDTIAGSLGDDTIRSGPGDDLVYGGDPPRRLGINPDEPAPLLPPPFPRPFPLDDGNDRIFAGSGDDTVFGGSGADTVRGGVGDDLIWGSSPGLEFPIRPFDGEIPIDPLPLPPQIDDLGDELRGGGLATIPCLGLRAQIPFSEALVMIRLMVALAQISSTEMRETIR